MEKNPSLYRLPPQSIDAEESILSSILIDNDTFLDVVEIVSSEDFYRSAHQKIFSAIVDLFSKNEPVDLVTLTNILKKKGEFEDIGGAACITNLFKTIPLAVNAQYYAKIIHDKADLRRLIDKSNAIIKRCYEDSGDVGDTINFAEKSVFEISENKIKPSFFRIGKLIDSTIDILENLHGSKQLITGIPTGFSQIDNLTSGLQGSDLIILAARPAMGKTTLALNIARNAAVDAMAPVALFSLEMSKEQLAMRLVCAEARVDSFRLKGGFLEEEDWRRVTDAAGTLTEAPIFIDDSPDITAMSIRAKARRLKMETDLSLIVVDYLQLIKGSASSERRDLELSEISRSLKMLAKELNVPVLALSQLNRRLEDRTDKRPQLSDLRESGALEQDADIVAFIYRDEVYNKDENNPFKGTAEFIIAKQRNGPVGNVKLSFLSAYTRFENYENPTHFMPN